MTTPRAPHAILRILPLLVAILAIIPFLPALDAEFVHWDDDVNFLNNPHYRGLGTSQIAWMFTTTLQAVYAPLAWVTLGVNYAIGGMDPRGYHLGNLLLHSTGAAVFFLVARRLIVLGYRPRPGSSSPAASAVGAAVAALVFAIHPLRVESVAWVSERRDVLSGVFYLLAVLAYLRGVERGPTLVGPWRLVSLLAFAGALLSKGLSMTLPLTLLVLDWYPLRRQSLGWHALLREKAPYFALALGGATAALVAVNRGSAWIPYDVYGPRARLAIVMHSIWFYPSSMLWPARLSPYYQLPVQIDPVEWRFLVPQVMVPAITLVLLLVRHRFPGGLAAWLHSAIAIAPVSGVLQAGQQLAADRFSYLSGLGFAVLAGAAVTWMLWALREVRVSAWLATATGLVTVFTLVGWGVGAWRLTQSWHDSETLWRAAVAVDPRCALCQGNLGATLMVPAPASQEARLEEAQTRFYLAIGLAPRHPIPYRNLATLLSNRGRLDEAEVVLRTLVARFPTFPDGPAQLGAVLIAQGRPGDAVELLRPALRRNPVDQGLRTELGTALLAHGRAKAKAGNRGEAGALFREAIDLAPEDPRPRDALRALDEPLPASVRR